MDLLKQQEELHDEGQKVLDELGLLPELQKYGQPVIVGSFALGLLTRRDIDLEVIVDSLNKKQVQGVCAYLVGLNLPRMDLTVMDNTVDKVPQLPNSYYVGIKYVNKDTPFVDRNPRNPLAWQIDTHFLTSEDSKAKAKDEDIKSKLTPEKKMAILEIKQEMTDNPKYHRTIFSVDIYDVVLDHRVTDLEGFKKYLQELGREL